MFLEDSRISLVQCGVTGLRLGQQEFELDGQKQAARGGTCLVYEALQKDPGGIGRRVILKEFYPAFSGNGSWRNGETGYLQLPQNASVQDRRENFRRSYERMKSFFNEEELNLYTVQAQGYLNANGTDYMVVDYGSGMTLAAYMQTAPGLYGFFSRMKVLALAVEKLHQRGLVHMDLKPENLLCYESHDLVKLLDTDSILEKNRFIGKPSEIVISCSPGYMAPEVAMLAAGLKEDWLGCYSERRSFAEIGHRADVYALGVILVHYLWGEDSRELSLEECLKQREPYLSSRAVRTIEEILEKTLAEDPDYRFESMAALAGKLDQLLPLLNPQRPRLAQRLSGNPMAMVGRGEMLEKMEQLLRSQSGVRSRVLCLSGIGGVGKSALARLFGEGGKGRYDVITEVSAASVWEAVERIGILHWEPDPDLSQQQYLQNRKTLLVQLCRQQKTLVIVHDYDVSQDPDFGIWWELGCDVILTSRHDWSGSGIATLTLGCGDLAGEQGKELFTQAYLENGETQERCRRLEILKDEDAALGQLLQGVDWHPLTLILLAKYMTGIPGQTMTPKQALEELDAAIFRKDSPREFQNLRDEAVRRENVYGHLAHLFRKTLDRSQFPREELETLRNMQLIPSAYGISVGRFRKWSGLSGDWLERLRQRGWLEYLPHQQDLLAEDGQPGVYVMPRVVQQVLIAEPSLAVAVSETHSYSDKLYMRYREESSYSRRQAVVSHLEQLLLFPEETTEGYLWLLLQLAEIYNTFTRLDKLKDTVDRIMAIYRKLPPESREDPDLSEAVEQLRRMHLLLGGHWKKRRKQKESFGSLTEAAQEIHCRFEYESVSEALRLAKWVRKQKWEKKTLRDEICLRAAMTSLFCKLGMESLGTKSFCELSWYYYDDENLYGDSSVDPLFFGAACDYGAMVLGNGENPKLIRDLYRLRGEAREKLGPENLFTCRLGSLLADALAHSGDVKQAAECREQALQGQLLPTDQAEWTLKLAMDYQDWAPEKAESTLQQAMAYYQEVFAFSGNPEELEAWYYGCASDAVEAGMIPAGIGMLEQWLEIAYRLEGPGQRLAQQYAGASRIFRLLGLKEKAKKYKHTLTQRGLATEQYRRLEALAKENRIRKT